MTAAETILIAVTLLLIFLVIGNLVFSKLAERRTRRLKIYPVRRRASPPINCHN